MVVFLFVVRQIGLKDDADCICCICALKENFSLDVVQGSRNKVSFFYNESHHLFQR